MDIQLSLLFRNERLDANQRAWNASNALVSIPRDQWAALSRFHLQRGVRLHRATTHWASQPIRHVTILWWGAHPELHPSALRSRDLPSKNVRERLRPIHALSGNAPL